MQGMSSPPDILDFRPGTHKAPEEREANGPQQCEYQEKVEGSQQQVSLLSAFNLGRAQRGCLEGEGPVGGGELNAGRVVGLKGMVPDPCSGSPFPGRPRAAPSACGRGRPHPRWAPGGRAC